MRAGYDVLFLTQSQLLGSLQRARAQDTHDRRFQALARVDLLILDDFGLKPLRSPQDEDLHDLIAERYERGSTVVTSNLDFSEWGEAFPNRLLGAATLDRLRNGAYGVVLEGDSHRKPRPLPVASAPAQQPGLRTEEERRLLQRKETDEPPPPARRSPSPSRCQSEAKKRTIKPEPRSRKGHF